MPLVRLVRFRFFGDVFLRDVLLFLVWEDEAGFLFLREAIKIALSLEYPNTLPPQKFKIFVELYLDLNVWVRELTRK